MELQHFELVRTEEMLRWAFKILRENTGTFDYAHVGGGSNRPVTERMLRFAEAGKVVAAVDKLAPMERALIRYTFARGADGEESEHFNLLHNHVYKTLEPEINKRRAPMRRNLALLCVQAPIEARVRILGAKSFFQSTQLCKYLGIGPDNFSHNYKSEWEAQIAVLQDLKVSAFQALDQWLIDLLTRRFAERDARGKPIEEDKTIKELRQFFKRQPPVSKAS